MKVGAILLLSLCAQGLWAMPGHEGQPMPSTVAPGEATAEENHDHGEESHDMSSEEHGGESDDMSAEEDSSETIEEQPATALPLADGPMADRVNNLGDAAGVAGDVVSTMVNDRNENRENIREDLPRVEDGSLTPAVDSTPFRDGFGRNFIEGRANRFRNFARVGVNAFSRFGNNLLSGEGFPRFRFDNRGNGLRGLSGPGRFADGRPGEGGFRGNTFGNRVNGPRDLPSANGLPVGEEFRTDRVENRENILEDLPRVEEGSLQRVGDGVPIGEELIADREENRENFRADLPGAEDGSLGDNVPLGEELRTDRIENRENTREDLPAGPFSRLGNGFPSANMGFRNGDGGFAGMSEGLPGGIGERFRRFAEGLSFLQKLRNFFRSEDRVINPVGLPGRDGPLADEPLREADRVENRVDGPRDTPGVVRGPLNDPNGPRDLTRGVGDSFGRLNNDPLREGARLYLVEERVDGPRDTPGVVGGPLNDPNGPRDLTRGVGDSFGRLNNDPLREGARLYLVEERVDGPRDTPGVVGGPMNDPNGPRDLTRGVGDSFGRLNNDPLREGARLYLVENRVDGPRDTPGVVGGPLNDPNGPRDLTRGVGDSFGRLNNDPLREGARLYLVEERVDGPRDTPGVVGGPLNDPNGPRDLTRGVGDSFGRLNNDPLREGARLYLVEERVDGPRDTPGVVGGPLNDPIGPRDLTRGVGGSFGRLNNDPLREGARIYLVENRIDGPRDTPGVVGGPLDRTNGPRDTPGVVGGPLNDPNGPRDLTRGVGDSFGRLNNDPLREGARLYLVENRVDGPRDTPGVVGGPLNDPNGPRDLSRGVGDSFGRLNNDPLREGARLYLVEERVDGPRDTPGVVGGPLNDPNGPRDLTRGVGDSFGRLNNDPLREGARIYLVENRVDGPRDTPGVVGGPLNDPNGPRDLTRGVGDSFGRLNNDPLREGARLYLVENRVDGPRDTPGVVGGPLNDPNGPRDLTRGVGDSFGRLNNDPLREGARLYLVEERVDGPRDTPGVVGGPLNDPNGPRDLTRGVGDSFGPLGNDPLPEGVRVYRVEDRLNGPADQGVVDPVRRIAGDPLREGVRVYRVEDSLNGPADQGVVDPVRRIAGDPLRQGVRGNRFVTRVNGPGVGDGLRGLGNGPFRGFGDRINGPRDLPGVVGGPFRR